VASTSDIKINDALRLVKTLGLKVITAYCELCFFRFKSNGMTYGRPVLVADVAY
jgi:hypothetical protein